MSVKPRKSTINPSIKTPNELRSLLNRFIRSIDNNFVTVTVSINVVVVEAPITNRRDRVITLSQRFRG